MNVQADSSLRTLARRSGAAVGLPGYAWDDRARRYVNLATGRYTAQGDINDLLRSVTLRASDTMAALAQNVSAGKLTTREFYEAMQLTLRQAYNANAALARGGWQQMTQADWGRNGHQLRTQYELLRSFCRDIEDGRLTLTQRPLSEAQIVARARLYADSAYGRYWQVMDERARSAGLAEGRTNTAGDDRVCQVCRTQQAKGWQALASFAPPLYHGGCRCDAEYR